MSVINKPTSRFEVQDMRSVGFTAGAPDVDENMPVDLIVAIEDQSPLGERFIEKQGKKPDELIAEKKQLEKEGYVFNSEDLARVRMLEKRPSNYRCFLVAYKGAFGPLNTFIHGKQVEDETGFHMIARAHPRSYILGTGSVGSDLYPVQVETDRSKIENHFKTKYKLVEWRSWDEVMKLFADR